MNLGCRADAAATPRYSPIPLRSHASRSSTCVRRPVSKCAGTANRTHQKSQGTAGGANKNRSCFVRHLLHKNILSPAKRTWQRIASGADAAMCVATSARKCGVQILGGSSTNRLCMCFQDVRVFGESAETPGCARQAGLRPKTWRRLLGLKCAGSTSTLNDGSAAFSENRQSVEGVTPC